MPFWRERLLSTLTAYTLDTCENEDTLCQAPATAHSGWLLGFAHLPQAELPGTGWAGPFQSSVSPGLGESFSPPLRRAPGTPLSSTVCRLTALELQAQDLGGNTPLLSSSVEPGCICCSLQNMHRIKLPEDWGLGATLSLPSCVILENLDLLSRARVGFL